MYFVFNNKTLSADAYLVIRNGEVWDVRFDASDYTVCDGEITEDMGSEYVSAIIPLKSNNVRIYKEV